MKLGRDADTKVIRDGQHRFIVTAALVCIVLVLVTDREDDMTSAGSGHTTHWTPFIADCWPGPEISHHLCWPPS